MDELYLRIDFRLLGHTAYIIRRPGRGGASFYICQHPEGTRWNATCISTNGVWSGGGMRFFTSALGAYNYAQSLIGLFEINGDEFRHRFDLDQEDAAEPVTIPLPLKLDFTIQGKEVWIWEYTGDTCYIYSSGQSGAGDLLCSNGKWRHGIMYQASLAACKEFAQCYSDKPVIPPELAGKVNKKFTAYLLTERKTPDLAQWLIEQYTALGTGAPEGTVEANLSSHDVIETLAHYRAHRTQGDPERATAQRRLADAVEGRLDRLLTVVRGVETPIKLPTTEELLVAAIANLRAKNLYHHSCIRCGNDTSRPATKRGRYLCLSCFMATARKCRHCGVKEAEDDMKLLIDGERSWYCLDCAGKLQVTSCSSCRHHFIGPPCDNIHVTADELRAAGHILCCFCVRGWRKCTCGKIAHQDDMPRVIARLESVEDDEPPRPRPVRDIRVCHACYERQDELDFTPIHWDATVGGMTDGQFSEVGSPRSFGVEIEVCQVCNIKKLPQRIKRYWSAKPDASLPAGGVELASVPLAGNDGLHVIRDLLNYAIKHEWAVNERAGLHVHFGLPTETVEQRAAIAMGYLMTQRIWLSFVAPSRRDGNCKHCINFRNPPDFYVPKSAADVLYLLTDGEGRERDGNGNGVGRRRWINWFAYRHYRTVELRVHQGTRSYEKIANWIKAHTRFIDWCAEQGTHQQVFDVFSKYRTNARAAFLFMARHIWKDWPLAKWFRERAVKLAGGDGYVIPPSRQEMAKIGIDPRDLAKLPACPPPAPVAPTLRRPEPVLEPNDGLVRALEREQQRRAEERERITRNQVAWMFADTITTT